MSDYKYHQYIPTGSFRFWLATVNLRSIINDWQTYLVGHLNTTFIMIMTRHIFSKYKVEAKIKHAALIPQGPNNHTTHIKHNICSKICLTIQSIWDRPCFFGQVCVLSFQCCLLVLLVLFSSFFVSVETH